MNHDRNSRGAFLRWPSDLPLVAGFIGALLAVAVVLIGWRIAQGAAELAQARALRLATQVAEEVERGFLLGLAPAVQTSLPRVLSQAQDGEPALVGGVIIDDEDARIASFGDGEALRVATWTDRVMRGVQPPGLRREGRLAHVGVPARDPAGRVAAMVWLTLDLGGVQQAALQASLRLALLASVLALVWIGLIAVVLRRWQPAAAARLRAAAGSSSTGSTGKPDTATLAP